MKKAKITKHGNETFLYVPKLNKEMRFNTYARHGVFLKFGKDVEDLTQKEIDELAKRH